ncbi:hypothetical protein [Halioglobus sp. HI00S01]|uniref:hypothetical protein n=1 Tax=Halioglobus sp. HI00S01 TaxID=1822214 RepID=UPI0012E7775D|nr:hypothetical protein [Halioglobus sp. HI00S01]
MHSQLKGIDVVSIDKSEITLRLPYDPSMVGNLDTGALHTMLLDQTLGLSGIAHDQVGTHITPTLDLRIDHMGLPKGDMT